MIVEVNDVVQPIGMMDTIIQFKGTTPAGDIVVFGVDHRPARELAQTIHSMKADTGLFPLAEIEDWQILSVVSPS